MQTELAVVDREKEEIDALARVEAWEIESKEDYSALDSFIAGLSNLIKSIKEDFKDSKDKAFEAHKAIVAQEKAHLDRVEKAKSLGKSKMSAWAEEQRKLEEAERQRLADEAKAKADKEAQEKAEQLEKQGDKEAAAAVINEAVKAPPPVVKTESFVPKTSTIFQTRWSATITDPHFVRKAIEDAVKFMDKAKTSEGKAAAEKLRQAAMDIKFMQYDQVALNKQATSTKDALKLGGVAFTSRKV